MTDRPSIPTGPPAWLTDLFKRFDDMLESMKHLSENVGLLVGQYQSIGKEIGNLDSRLRRIEEVQNQHTARISKLERKA